MEYGDRPHWSAKPPNGVTLDVEGGEPFVLRLAGELDLDGLALLGVALDDAADERPDVLVLDMAALTFFGICGLSLLLGAQIALGERNARLVLLAPPPMLVRMLELTGRIEAVDIVGERPSARP